MQKTIFLLLTLFISSSILSQQLKVTRDVGTWLGVNIKKKISPAISLKLSQQVRLFTKSTKVDDYLLDIGGKYKLNNNFKMGANLRYTHDVKRWKPSENNFRYNLDMNYKGRLLKKTTLQYRLRFQKTFINLLDDYNTTKNSNAGLRNKIKLNYRLNKKNTINTSFELFRLIEKYRTPYFNKLRVMFGDKINVRKNELNISIGIEQEINSEHPLSFFLFKTTYTF